MVTSNISVAFSVTFLEIHWTTLIVPALDHSSFWDDPSEFKDIFNVRDFIDSLKMSVFLKVFLPLSQGLLS